MWASEKPDVSQDLKEMFKHMSEVCRSVIRRTTKIDVIIRNLKGASSTKNARKWYCKYHKIARSFFNEDFEQSNRETREVINEFKGESLRNIDLEIDFYLLGIDASIKNGNLDRDLIKSGEALASNDPAIILRSLMIDILDFEISRLNDINVREVIDNIESKGTEALFKCLKDLGTTEMYVCSMKIEAIWNVMKEMYTYVKRKRLHQILM